MKPRMTSGYSAFVMVVITCTIHLSAQAQWIPSDYGVSGGMMTSITAQGANLVASTREAGVYRSTDQGLNWQRSNNGLTPLEVNVVVSSSTTLFAGTRFGVYTSDNGGQLWSYAGMQTSYIADMAVSGNLVAAAGYGIHVSKDNGLTWTLSLPGETSGMLYAITLAGQTLIAGNSSGDVFRSTDQGATWSKAKAISGFIYALTAQNDIVFAAGNNGIQRSIDGGITWSAIPTSTTYSSRLQIFNNTLIATQEKNIIILTDLGGDTWIDATINQQAPAYITGFASDGTHLFASSNNGGIVFSDDAGMTWNPRNEGLINLEVNAFIAIGNTVFAGGRSGIFSSADHGLTWTKTNFELPSSIGYVTSFTSLDGLLYVSIFDWETPVLRSQDNGATWTPASGGLENTYIEALITMGDRLYAATNSGVYVTMNGGMNWTLSGLENNFIRTLFAKDNTLFASLNNFGLYRSTDMGATWTAITFKIPNGDVYSMASHNNKIYAGTSNGVYVTDDYGETWVAVSPVLLNFMTGHLYIDGDQLFITSRNSADIYSYSGNSVQKISPTNLINGRFDKLFVSGGLLLASMDTYSDLTGSIWTLPLSSIASISSFAPQQGKVGTEVTIYGTGFSTVKEKNVVQFNNEFATVISATANTITVRVPGAVGSATLKITVNNKVLTALAPFTITPEFIGFSPASGIVGTRVSIEGSGLQINYVLFGDVLAPVISQAATNLVVEVPYRAISGKINLLLKDGMLFSSTESFTVIPEIIEFNPATGKVGTQVVINGSGFHPNYQNNIVTFNGVSAQIMYGNENSIMAVVPAGATTGSIAVKVSGVTTISKDAFTLLPLPVNCFTVPAAPTISELPGSILLSSSPTGNQWFFKGFKLFGQNKQTLFVTETGDYTAQVTIDGCTGPLSERYSVIFTGGIMEESTIELFPNPATTQVTLKVNKATSGEPIDIMIYNNTGQLVMKTKSYTDTHTSLDVSGLSAGVYLCQMMNKHESHYTRLIID